MLSQVKIIYIILLLFSYSIIAADLKIVENNDSFENVIQWWLPESENFQPIPLFQNSVQINNKQIQFNDPIYLRNSNRNYLGIMDLKNDGKNKILNTQWFDKNGELYGSVLLEHPFDFPFPGFVIAYDGSKIISISLNNLIDVYSTNGEAIKQFPIIGNYHFNYENNIHFRQCKNTDQIFVAISQAGFPLDNKNVYYSELLLIDSEGNKQFSKKYPEWQVTSVNATDNAEFFSIAMHHTNFSTGEITFKSLVLDKNGEEIAVLPIRHRKSYFSTGTTILFLDKTTSFLYNLNSNEIEKKLQINQPNNIFIDAIFLQKNTNVLLLEGEVTSAPERKSYPWAYKNILLQIFDFENQSTQKFIQIKDTKVYEPTLGYNNFNDQVFFGHSTGWKILKYQP